MEDVVNGKLSKEEAYAKLKRPNYISGGSSSYWLYHIVSDVYIDPSVAYNGSGSRRRGQYIKEQNSSYLTFGDDYEYAIYNDKGQYLEAVFDKKYNISENSDLKQGQLYKVFYEIAMYEGRIIYSAEVKIIVGLLTYDQSQAKDAAEKKKLEEAKAAQKKAETEAEYKKALASRNVDTILRFLSKYGSDDGLTDEMRKNGRKEAAKIITKNNNAKLEDDAYIIWGGNPYAFNTGTVYYCSFAYAGQFLERKIVAKMANSPNLPSILLQNIPNIQSIEGHFFNIFMQYAGVTTLRMANGGAREMATFNVLYYQPYQN